MVPHLLQLRAAWAVSEPVTMEVVGTGLPWAGGCMRRVGKDTG